jgi:hypothetical protein
LSFAQDPGRGLIEVLFGESRLLRQDSLRYFDARGGYFQEPLGFIESLKRIDQGLGCENVFARHAGEMPVIGTAVSRKKRKFSIHKGQAFLGPSS